MSPSRVDLDDRERITTRPQPGNGVTTPVGSCQTMDQMARVLGYGSQEALRKAILDAGGYVVLREHGWTYEADQ